MYERVSLDDLETRDVEGVEPGLRAIGLELRPEKMRPSVWTYDEGDQNNRHRQREQEELYVVLDGRFEVEVDGDEFELGVGEYLIVSPDAWRQLTAVEESTLLAVGAPNTKDDAIDEGEGESED